MLNINRATSTSSSRTSAAEVQTIENAKYYFPKSIDLKKCEILFDVMGKLNFSGKKGDDFNQLIQLIDKLQKSVNLKTDTKEIEQTLISNNWFDEEGVLNLISLAQHRSPFYTRYTRTKSIDELILFINQNKKENNFFVNLKNLKQDEKLKRFISKLHEIKKSSTKRNVCLSLNSCSRFSDLKEYESYSNEFKFFDDFIKWFLKDKSGFSDRMFVFAKIAEKNRLNEKSRELFDNGDLVQRVFEYLPVSDLKNVRSITGTTASILPISNVGRKKNIPLSFILGQLRSLSFILGQLRSKDEFEFREFFILPSGVLVKSKSTPHRLGGYETRISIIDGGEGHLNFDFTIAFMSVKKRANESESDLLVIYTPHSSKSNHHILIYDVQKKGIIKTFLFMANDKEFLADPIFKDVIMTKDEKVITLNHVRQQIQVWKQKENMQEGEVVIGQLMLHCELKRPETETLPIQHLDSTSQGLLVSYCFSYYDTDKESKVVANVYDPEAGEFLKTVTLRKQGCDKHTYFYSAISSTGFGIACFDDEVRIWNSLKDDETSYKKIDAKVEGKTIIKAILAPAAAADADDDVLILFLISIGYPDQTPEIRRIPLKWLVI